MDDEASSGFAEKYFKLEVKPKSQKIMADFLQHCPLTPSEADILDDCSNSKIGKSKSKRNRLPLEIAYFILKISLAISTSSTYSWHDVTNIVFID